MHKEQRFGITAKKKENFPEWYSQVLLRGNMHDYYDIKGCFIVKPQAMFVWKQIQRHFTAEIEKLGVQEYYFPMLVTKTALEKEKTHLENFSPELAWIAMCGDTELESPVAVRPTSETIIYPSFAKWLRSHRDVPLKINQWCNVLRWEVRSTLPFIRGREFLWQEGHSAYLTSQEAEEEVRTILELYKSVYTDLLAVPVMTGRKSENEKFGGAEYTLSVEAFIPETGKGVQAATSHFLGTNFSKMFDIQIESQAEGGEPVRSHVFQTSWGMTTRSIGIAVMVHSDDIGLVLPPKVAMHQVVIIACGITARTTEEARARLCTYIAETRELLASHGIRVHVDDKDNTTPGHKFNYWELQGVPIRMEIGPLDMKDEKVTIARRMDGAKSRRQVPREGLENLIAREIQEIHDEMYKRAKEVLDSKVCNVSSCGELIKAVNSRNIARAVWCGEASCEEVIRERSVVKDEDGTVVQTGAKSLCIVEQGGCPMERCFHCGANATCTAIFGRTY